MERKKQKSKQASGRAKAKVLRENTGKDKLEQKQKTATAGEVQYGQTIGRHGSEEETTLNPEE
jgi:hypothetical protein